MLQENYDCCNLHGFVVAFLEIQGKHKEAFSTLGESKNLEEKDGQTQLLCYVSLIRACNKVL